MYEAAERLACIPMNEYNYCASCGRWGGNDFDGRDEHDDDCALYVALLSAREVLRG